MTDVRILTRDDVEDLLDVEGVVDAVREAYRRRGEGAPARPRTRLAGGDPKGLVTGYTAILPGIGTGGYMYTAGFASRDAWFVLPLFDAETGAPAALLDGAALNPIKTGAAGAVAVDALAREDASVLALIGSGHQAWGQLRCAATVRDLEEVRVFSPTRDHREAFAATARDELGLEARAAGSPGQALAGADVVVTATRATDPVFDDADLADSSHVTAMGQYHPDRAEVPPETVARSLYVPDLRERVPQDSGEFLRARKAGLVDGTHIHAELGEVVAGKAAGRTADEQVTLFDSGGTAVETLACAAFLLERAEVEDRGRLVPWSSASEAMFDPRDR